MHGKFALDGCTVGQIERGALNRSRTGFEFNIFFGIFEGVNAFLKPWSRMLARRSCSQDAGQSFMPTHSRKTVRSAVMITGPRKSPISPNVRSPPKIPISANRKGNRALPPTSAG